MPREAKLFTSSAGSAVRGYLKFRANIPPRWIKNARGSRKRIEPEIAEGFRFLKRLRIRRPRAKVVIRNAQRELRSVLDRWETAYRKENFYRGIRILLELQRAVLAPAKNGASLAGCSRSQAATRESSHRRGRGTNSKSVSIFAC